MSLFPSHSGGRDNYRQFPGIFAMSLPVGATRARHGVNNCQQLISALNQRFVNFVNRRIVSGVDSKLTR
jgi:hypothetical protein